MAPEDWRLVEEYARNYSYYYMNGNDTTVRIGMTELLREIIAVIDQKAYIDWANSTGGTIPANLTYMSQRKYSYKQGKPETMAMLLVSLGVPYGEWLYHLVPRFGSSATFKLYKYTTSGDSNYDGST